MQNIANAARDFIEAIKHSNLYIDYQNQLSVLKEDEELYKSFNDFRKDYYGLLSSSEDSFEKMEEVTQRYRYVLDNPKVSGFMKAEDKFCLSIKEIYSAIAEKLDLDMDFIEM
ncbi:MAG: YlbF family regulator [Lachnospiraceae bacterium]|nr:YlbF family regulator [Lachnospiraceae bacterium]